MAYVLKIIQPQGDGTERHYTPVILDEITWETEMTGSPSKLTFTVVKDDVIKFDEGNVVQLYDDETGKGIFAGYVFEKRRDKKQHIEVTAYDQLRYFKNKLSVNYTKKSASDLLKLLADDFKLKVGTVRDTGYKIPARDEDNQTYFDIILNAIDLTFDNRGKYYVLYDDFGKIYLEDIENMSYNYWVKPETCENFSYTTSIDKDTFTEVLVLQENSKGKRDPYIYPKELTDKKKQWGILREVVTASRTQNAEHIAKTILDAKCRVTRDLEITGCLGDPFVRAGVSIYVTLYIGDKNVMKYLLCEKVTHHFRNGSHTMDITVSEHNNID